MTALPEEETSSHHILEQLSSLNRRLIPARGIQVDPHEGSSSDPLVMESKQYLYCVKCACDLWKGKSEDHEQHYKMPPILGITPIMELTTDPTVMVASIVVRCPQCQGLLSSRINSDIYNLLVAHDALPA